ncbi:hypothetical protein [Corallincola holothuriorum]|uniref:hypothetical protein n=1 Tax=Corallincola holothuriorum TaxID=2282215 RepID=UPI0011C042B5|nr:hypothetical protein [Corallincola holothuriorum]
MTDIALLGDFALPMSRHETFLKPLIVGNYFDISKSHSIQPKQALRPVKNSFGKQRLRPVRSRQWLG